MKQKVDAALQKASSNKYKDFILKKGEQLSSIGVDNERDLRKFHHISQYVPVLVRRALGSGNKAIYSEVGKFIFDRHLISVNGIDDLLKKVILALDELDLKKIGYPIGNLEPNPIKSYDVNKWISAANEMYMKMRLFGTTKQGALYAITKGWNDMEKNKFQDWLNYYEGGASKTYNTKKAQYATNNAILSMRNIPGLTQSNSNSGAPIQEYSKSNEEALAMQRTKASLIGRINSAIKLLSSNAGQRLMGKEYESLLRSLTNLQYDVLSVKASDMINNLIVRASNSLKYEGNKYGADMIIKIAQEPDPLAGLIDDGPDPSFTDNSGAPSDNSAATEIIATMNDLGYSKDTEQVPSLEDTKEKIIKEKQEALPSMPPMPPMPEPAPPVPAPPAPAPPAPVPSSPDKPDDSLKDNGKPPSGVEDKKEAAYAWATYKTAELKNLENIVDRLCSIASETLAMHKTAQMSEIPEIEDRKPPFPEKASVDAGEDAINKALANIQVSDVVKRLQALSRVFKNREIARQLGIIDLMLDKLGIAGLFPQLAEATRSALESNQYTSVRIDEILSKLMSVIDERGNVKVTVQQDNESLIDKEMKDALQQSDAMEGKVESALPEELVAPSRVPIESKPSIPIAPPAARPPVV